MLVIGLTGGIATGKSTVSSLLKKSDIPIIDADLIARQVVLPGTPALAAIIRTFGEEVLFKDGFLDRKKLGSIIFDDEVKRKQLNAIVHPAVRRRMFWKTLSYWIRGYKYCVLDVPLLIEGGLNQWVGQVVVVYCSEEIQLRRLMARDMSSENAALSRLRSQMPIAEKIAYADIVLDNSGPESELRARVQELITTFDKQVGWSWRISWLLPPIALLSATWWLFWRSLKGKRRNSNKKKD
ncbi:CoaE-domain-containing protein [Crepidotus variabilis]|uniref:CoaE-domain-containing protein n=1 Tax=Crepidotus variabilis TaxID=179855 RepID=A0A9P6EFJ5_9AGAR|nr:CoaE-domain-containing protein [Crepidotus variabilis]